MTTSKTIYNFRISQEQGKTLLTAQEYPWSVFQVIPVTPGTFQKVKELCEKRGMVAEHDSDKSFLIIHLCSGDQDGKYPEHHIEFRSPRDTDKYLQALQEAMAQAAVWYHTNIVIGHRKI